MVVCQNQHMTLTPAVAAPRFDPDRCANCFEPLPDSDKHRPWLFCSVLCQDTAGTVRYWRATSRDGRFEADPSVRLAISTRLAHMLAGGYNAAGRRIPADVRVLVIERDRVCVKCGNPGEEIDHIDGDSGDPENLQLLCRDCHHQKTASHMVLATTDQSARVFVILISRVIPDTPAQMCDDEFNWQRAWLQLRRERIARLRSAAANRRQEMAAAKLVVKTVEFEDDDDDSVDRDEDYYAGFGENSHYSQGADGDY